MTDNSKKSILHVSTRDILRPIRDQVLAIAGFAVESCQDFRSGLTTFQAKPFDLVLIDVEGEDVIPQAERLCSEVKTTRREQLVAFVCNWRVAVLTDCPDEILRTEFDPAAFIAGVRKVLEEGPGA